MTQPTHVQERNQERLYYTTHAAYRPASCCCIYAVYEEVRCALACGYRLGLQYRREYATYGRCYLHGFLGFIGYESSYERVAPRGCLYPDTADHN